MGKPKVLGVRKCSNCGENVEIRHKERLSRVNIFCCKKCEGEFKRKNKKMNCKCDYCGKDIYVKPSRLKQYKRHYCSSECHYKHKEEYFKGENNHQYGLKGDKNASWKSDEKITIYGYKKIRMLDHPFKDCDGFVFEHRLVAEQYLLNDDNSVIINGKKYLKPELEVHHKDEDKLNNNPNNLIILTKSEHMSIHSKKRQQNK